jgi:hypothetical protein
MEETDETRLKELIREVGMDNIFEVLKEEMEQIAAGNLIKSLERKGLTETALFKLEEHLLKEL